MDQVEFEHALFKLLKQSLSSATFTEVKPVAEALLYSNFLPTVTSNLNTLEKRRLVFLVEKFRRYSCSSVSRRQQLKSLADNLSLQTPPLKSNQLVDPLAQKLGLDEDLNHLKSQLLTLQTRHYHQEHM
ncbi:hypothetical protein KTJ16_14120 [Acinetobacter bereziniae]|nr:MULTISPECIES: hypothetical protein [Acinetobacter]MBJ8422477.1 hypothetical protein [Acinetobacter bereziniae]MCU4473009.1 hypothetical protein [Acinetobacter bereziniae]MCU4538719.1 hypothetical protein [Acinetobacter bereziniae]MCU4542300.1 hypothetical protein [Acinetobacter bereziniae]MCU4624946.1 hypothetical protein [Acinetobacter bereziniae]